MNNPAAAPRRGTRHLRDRLRMLSGRAVGLAGGNLSVAETLVAAGVTEDELEALASSLPERALPDAVAWLGGGLEAELLLRGMDDAATRITMLVASVKSDSHMDETHTLAETDLYEGLESTLHRGDIGVESRPGDTCFQVRLPVRPSDAPGPRGTAASTVGTVDAAPDPGEETTPMPAPAAPEVRA